MKKTVKVKAAPYEGQNAPMEVHEGAEYSQDTSVHAPKVKPAPNAPEGVEEKTSVVDIERNPKPEAKDPHDLTEPLKYVVSAPDAIEKIEGLLAKIEESMPALKPLVAEVRSKMNEMEAVVLGDEYVAHEASEAEPQVETEARPDGAKFASGDKVTVVLKDETYNGTLLDRNEDGTWEVQTDGYVALHKVPESDIQMGAKNSIMLPAAMKEKKMKALVAALEALTTAVKAGTTEVLSITAASAFDVVEELDLGGGYVARKKKGKVEAAFSEDGHSVKCDKCGAELSTMVGDEDHLCSECKEAEGEGKVTASVIDDKEIDLGQGYSVRKAKKAKSSEKD